MSCTAGRDIPELNFREVCDGSRLSLCDVSTEGCQASLFEFIACVLERPAQPRPGLSLGGDLTILGTHPAPLTKLDRALLPALALAKLVGTATPAAIPGPQAVYFPSSKTVGLAGAPQGPADRATFRELARAYTHALQDQEVPLPLRFERAGSDLEQQVALSAVLAGEGELAADFVERALDDGSIWDEYPSLPFVLREVDDRALDLRSIDRLLRPSGRVAMLSAWQEGQTGRVRELLSQPPSTASILTDHDTPLAAGVATALPTTIPELPLGFELQAQTRLGAAAVALGPAKGSTIDINVDWWEDDRFFALKRSTPPATAHIWFVRLTTSEYLLDVGASDSSTLDALEVSGTTYARALDR